MPGNGNGGGNGYWTTGEGGRQETPGPWQVSPFAPEEPPEPTEPPPRVPVIREARNIQRARIDRTSLYDPTAATQALGTDYLQSRNASNPQAPGMTGAGAVGYELPDGSFSQRIY